MPRPPRLITLNGVTKPLTEWAHDLDLSVTTLFHRLARGWTPEEALDSKLVALTDPHDWSTRKDITGQRFGKLVALKYVEQDDGRKAMWLCACDCGKEAIVQGKRMRSGASKSCGCGRIESIKRIHTTHGATAGGVRTPEYWCWAGMHTRCSNPKQSHWKYYGGRGIKVCERWRGRQGFANFLADMGPRPAPGYTIDRFPDPDGNYEPGNCRWATVEQQNANRSKAQPWK